MSGNLVSWTDYAGIDGFGATSQQDLADLNKALTAGAEINAPGVISAGDGFALRVESLERTLRSVTFSATHIKLWRNVPKIPAFNTVEEHNIISEFGTNPDAGWIAEGDLPEEDDSTYERKYAVVKFLGTTRRVTHVMATVRPAHGNVIANETVNGTLHILRMTERALFKGDSNLSSLQFDGYERLLLDNAPETNIIDLRGAALSEDILTDGCMVAYDAPNYGMVTDCYLNPRVKSDLVKTFFPKERHNTFNDKSGTIGNDIKSFTSPSGDVRFQTDTFIDDGGGTPAAAIGDPAKIPATPTVSTAATTPVYAASKFEDDDAGNYFYKIVACNRYGKSAAVDLSAGPAAVAVAAGDEVTWAMTPGSAVAVEWYEVYRTKVGGAVGTARRILRVPNAAGAGAQTIRDFNDWLPGTTTVYLFQQNLEAMSCKQLAPLVKIPLATIDSSIRWMQLLYIVPVIYAYGKHTLLVNVGRAAGAVDVAA